MRIDTGISEQVEGYVGMLCEAAPEVHRKSFFHAGKSCNEVVLPCANGFLGIVSSVIVWRD